MIHGCFWAAACPLWRKLCSYVAGLPACVAAVHWHTSVGQSQLNTHRVASSHERAACRRVCTPRVLLLPGIVSTGNGMGGRRRKREGSDQRKEETPKGGVLTWSSVSWAALTPPIWVRRSAMLALKPSTWRCNAALRSRSSPICHSSHSGWSEPCCAASILLISPMLSQVRRRCRHACQPAVATRLCMC